MRYSANTPTSLRAMLDRIGAKSVEDLLATIPADVRLDRELEIAGPMPEADLRGRLEELKGPRPRISLVGGGLYDHYVPAPVDALAGRSEWVTSYTPYQPELAQGTLVMYYEFQTYVAQLTGQEIANAGMYDGSTALSEAVLMAARVRTKADPVVYVSAGLHPEYLAVLRTYMRFVGIEVATVALEPESGRTAWNSVDAASLAKAQAIVVQSPNFFGVIEDAAALPADAFKIGVCTEALSMAMLAPLPVEIMVGEIQSFGIPIQLGGPTAGFFATRKDWVRKMPGRLVGRSQDVDGKEAFCITLATREQFIRREKATSNICTSSGLMCLRATIYMSLLGGRGLERLAEKNARTARFFARGFEEMGLPLVHRGPYFNEFVIDCSAKPGLHDALQRQDLILGLPLDRFHPERKNQYLVAFTERHHGRAEAILQEVKNLVQHS
ncbi:MAG: aminomethyl-transferring glycine dehydrogenase subunit GcvPA [Planctomycetes bacterium]|nr:aminomethyl-transferring glycine dehydrogenase subunit GcvPA [Planctomycetota bacterium]